MRKVKRIISLLLSLILFCVFELGNPLRALAEELENIEDIAAYADANTFSAGTVLEYSPLTGEEEASRSESQRVFRRADGAMEAVSYAQPVCYWDEGQWKLIDNTLVSVTLANGTEVYQNKSSDMTVSFGQRFNSDKLVTIEQDGHTLSWRFVGNISAELEPVQTPSAEVIETPAPVEPESTEIEDAPVPAEPEAGDYEDTAQQPEAWVDEYETDEQDLSVFERLYLLVEEQSEDNDWDLIPEFYIPEDTNADGYASLFSFTDWNGNVHYRIYGQVGEVRGFFACDALGEQIEFDAPISELDDRALLEAAEETESNGEENAQVAEEDETSETSPAPKDEIAVVPEDESHTAEPDASEELTEQEEPTATPEGSLPPVVEIEEQEELVAEVQTDLFAYDTFPISAVSGQVHNGESRTVSSEEEADDLLRFPPELVSEIEYADEATGLNVRYVLNGKTLYEYITLEEAPQNAVAYSMELQVDGLTPVLQDGMLYFADGQGESVFQMGQPVMVDATGAQSVEVETQLSIYNEETGTYLFTLIPDQDWLTAEEREYPLSIDPDIKPTFSSVVEDTYVNSSDPTATPYERSCIYISASQYQSLIRIRNLPALSSGDVILEASLNLCRYLGEGTYTNKEVYCYRITEEWNQETACWNNKPEYDTSAIASFGITARTGYFTELDITSLVKDWYENPASNYGVLLQGDYALFASAEWNEASSSHPYLSIVYRNTTGLESTWSYYSQSAGRAGEGAVNVFSGNLTWSFEDGSILNGVLPISLSHVYNTNDRDTDIGYGMGWRLNYAQTIEKVTLPNRTDTQTYYCWTDGDGTRLYYESDGDSLTEFVSETDRDSRLNVNGSTVTIMDKQDNCLVFTCDEAVTCGRLTKITDANGNAVEIAYVSDDVTDLKISSITEQLSGSSAGQSLTLTYEDRHLSALTAPDGLNRTYTYSNNRLTGFSATDDASCAFSYQNDCLSEVENIDGYTLKYTYTSSAPYRVTRVQEYANGGAGQYLAFSYGRNKTIVTDSQNRDTVYRMDNLGQPVSVADNEGRAVYAAYNTESGTVHQLKALSKTQYTVVNLLSNHGFEESSSSPKQWTRSSSSSIAIEGSKRHVGRRSVKFTLSSSSERALTQTVSVTPGETYTFSAWFSGTSGKAFVRVIDGRTTINGDAVTTTGTAGTDWTQGSVTFTPASSSVTVAIVTAAGSGTVYADSAQLEKSSSPSRYNMLENSDFSSGFDSFAANYTTDNYVVNLTSGDYGNFADTHPDYLDDNVLMFSKTGKSCYYKQTITISGSAGDVYSYGGWLRSNCTPTTSQWYNYTMNDTWHIHKVQYGIKRLSVNFLNSSGTVLSTTSTDFSNDTNEWQFASGVAVATSSYAKVELMVEYTRCHNIALVDGLQLYREEFSQAYTYDEDGNLTGYSSLIGQTNSFQYNGSDDLTSVTDARGNPTTYTYDENHNLLTATSPEGTTTSYTYNDRGQSTAVTVGGETGIRSSSTYDAATALTTAITDARGNSVSYGYNATTRLRTTLTDAKGNTSTYTYGDAENMLRLASLTGAGTGTVQYGYDEYGKLIQISRTSATYSFTYDSWNRSKAVKVGGITLSENQYDTYGRLSTTTYANGFSARYVYDALDRVEKIYHTSGGTETLTYTFVYDGEGNLYELRNHKTGRTTFFQYDHSGRCMASTEKTFTGTETPTYTGTVSGYTYQYDANNNLSKLTCTTGATTWSVTYTYDKDNRPTVATLTSGKTLTNTYDSLGRLTRKRWSLSSNYDTTISYLANTDGTQTALVASWQNGSDTAYTYRYDANGNITQISQGSTIVTYSYDAANQLVRENNGFTNQTVTYEYDSWGNILNKKTYAYTTGDLTTPVTTDTDTYGNESWGDQLTAYNGQSISYDEMGNPTTYLGYTMGWQGKQLISANNGTHNITYTYNEDGLRLTKTVNGTTTNYYYNGSVLISMATGSTTQQFHYDASGSVIAVTYNGTEYYYVRNAQGDIIKLIDSTGATVVEYTYDSWGKLLSTTGSLASTLGADQPFRYRGYVYDTETSLYYLQTRYYDPTTCRFISSDVVLSTGQGVLGHNAYAYCLNNPVNRMDVSGCDWEDVKDFFTNGWNAVRTLAENLIGTETTITGNIDEEVNGVIQFYGITCKMTQGLEFASSTGDGSTKLLTIYNSICADDLHSSTCGIKLSLLCFGADVRLGIKDTGVSFTLNRGNGSISCGAKINLVEMQGGIESSMEYAQRGIVAYKRTYGSINLIELALFYIGSYAPLELPVPQLPATPVSVPLPT